MAKKQKSKAPAPKKETVKSAAPEIQGSGDPSEEEGDELDEAPDGGETAPENNMTTEQIEAARVLNERLEAVTATFGGKSFVLYDDEEDRENPFVSILAEDESEIIEEGLGYLEELAEHVPALLTSFEGAAAVGIGGETADGEHSIVILDEEGKTLSEGTLEELLEQAAELQSTAIQDRVQAVIDFHKGKDVVLPESVDMDAPEGIEITLTTEDGTVLTKTLGDFESEIKEAAEAEAKKKTKKGRPAKGSVLEVFKARNMPWRPTNVLRVMRDFSFEGESYKKGQIFDWYALGLHRVKVKRLFAQRLIRHAVEDMGTIYPFKAPQKKVKKEGGAGGWDSLPEHMKPKKKSEAPEGSEEIGDYDDSEEMQKRRRLLNREKHGTGGSKDELDDRQGNYGGPRKKNFSIKGDLSDK